MPGAKFLKKTIVTVLLAACLIDKGYAQAKQTIESASSVLKKVSTQLSSAKTMSYDQERLVDEPDVSLKGTYGGQFYLDYTIAGEALSCRFQFENDDYKIVFNGTEDFMLNKNKKTFEFANPDAQLFDGYSCMNHSLYSLRNALPILISDTTVLKSVGDTTIGQKTYYNIRITLKEKLIKNNGELSTTQKNFNMIYNLIVDQQTFLPAFLTRRNNADHAFVGMSYSNIQLNAPPRGDDTYLYSTYVPAYQQTFKRRPQPLQAGSLLPQFSLISLDGEEVSSHTYTGKYLLIEFWIKNCGFCVNSVPELNQIMKTDSRLNVVGINMNDSESNVKFFVNKYAPKYTILVNGESFGKKLGISFYPTVILVSPEGKILYNGVFDPAPIKKLIN